VAVALFLASVPVFLITTNVRWVINAPLLYSHGFDKYYIPAWTGIDRDELLSAAGQIRDYFNNKTDSLQRTVVQYGIQGNLYKERELEHMKDVKGLVRGLYLVQLVTGAYIVAFAGAGLAFRGRRSLSRLWKYVGLGGAATLGLVVAVGLGSLVGFDRLFLAFHLISFSNDLWQLDPARHNLIAMFPEGFFFDATMWIAGSTIVEALFLSLIPLVFLWWLPRRASG
jgi:integral membrane protein (TIGR01906 family)